MCCSGNIGFLDLYSRGSYLNISILSWESITWKVPRFFSRCWICWCEPSKLLIEHFQWHRSLLLFRVILAWPHEGILCDVQVVMMYFLKIVSLTCIHKNKLTFLSQLTHILERETSHAFDGISSRVGSRWESHTQPFNLKAALSPLYRQENWVFERLVFLFWKPKTIRPPVILPAKWVYSQAAKNFYLQHANMANYKQVW